jgi:uncharacterized membrane protein (DUF4010 family)
MEVHLTGIATALGVGLLIGVERESRNGEDDGPVVAGVRTFTLISLSGAMAAIIGMPAVVAGAIFVGLAGLMSYRASSDKSPGLTTEVAMFATFLLGVLAMSELALSAALGAGIALVLSAKSRLHGFVRDTLSRQELHDGLLLLGAVLIVLPLLPDRPLDPWGVFNLQKLWRLVVLVMAINALGYVAQRALGPRLGLPISGLAGGFISATATTAAMATHTRNNPEETSGAIAGALLANLATIIQLAIVLGLLAPELLNASRYALAFAGAIMAIAGGLAGWHAWHALAVSEQTPRGRAFDIRAALTFVAIVASILLISALLSKYFGQNGAMVAAAVGGLADAHAPAASVAQLNVAGTLTLGSAMIAITLALATNSLSKMVLAFANGTRGFGLAIAAGLTLMIAAFAGGMWLSRSLIAAGGA